MRVNQNYVVLNVKHANCETIFAAPFKKVCVRQVITTGFFKSEVTGLRTEKLLLLKCLEIMGSKIGELPV